MRPEISIVIPTYNQRPEYLKKCLDSFFEMETDPKFEVICVDDGSNIPFSGILTGHYPDNFSFHREQKNSGTGSALNLGFRKATGRFGMYAASDCLYYRNCLARLYSGFQDGIISTYGNFHYISDNGDLIAHGVPRENAQEYLIEAFDLGIAWMWRMEDWRAVGGFDSRICEDYDLAVKLAPRGKFIKVGEHQEFLAAWREHVNSISRLQHGENRIQTARIKEMAKCLLKK